MPSTDERGSPLHFHREMPELNRRQLMALLAASSALANGACSAPDNGSIQAFSHLPEAQVNGTPLYYASACIRDGHAHGVLIACIDGRPIKVEGHPGHPASLGATDAITQASVLQLWDPDRSSTVLEGLGDPKVRDAAAPLATSSWAAFDTAWQAERSRLAATGGEGLYLLTGPITSPTQRALLQALLARFPKARWHVHAPLRDEAQRAGSRAAFGRELVPMLHLDRARCVLALAADPFSDGPAAVRQARDWAAARAVSPAQAFAVEVQPGLFGARADARLALPPPRIEAMLWRLARHWLPGVPAGEAGNPAELAFETRVLRALRAAGSDALVVAGRDLSPEAHALTLALNQRLGAIGRTLTLIEPPDGAPEAASLSELAQALRTDAVDTLVMLDCNPAYASAGALGMSEALGHARLRIHAGLYPDETAQLCHWHLPLSHDYEQWSDARALDGSVSLQQPAIAPLYDTRSALEVLALLADSPERQGYALLRAQWQDGRGGDFERWWREAVRQGLIAGTAAPAVSVGPARLPGPPPAGPPQDALLACFAADPAAHDGRYANLGWLQELPRPFTKLTWDNAVLIGPRTAEARALTTGQRVKLGCEGRWIEAPVWISDRHAEGVLTLTVGQGRRSAGRVGSGVGFDAYALQPLAGPARVELHALDARHAFAVTQHEISQHGRDIARTLRPGEALPRAEELPNLYTDSPPIDVDHAWAMVIDLDACIGCNACTAACQAENNIPVVGKDEVARGREMHWIRVDRYDAPEIDNTIFHPLPCMHCEKAPCELVCPVGATVHDSEGLNVQVYNRCIGTRFCSNNCPYKVRRFNFLQFSDTTTESLKAQRNPDVTVRQRGVMEKCSYCVQRISRGRHHAENTGQPMADGDVVSACQAVCPTRAIHFGDLRLPGSDVARLRESPRHYALLGELNTRPRTTYLARVGPHPASEGDPDG
ncbi:4Fe-4S dicluster domain-containing protein [Roseateles sp.]|uniref:4Fe-4S dicluster domain-containing protein n=1 Tax=Roseateles sp. TaxID=1971397 RepID=UPI002E0B7FBC|nr:4Fe-4S dicluster domain-containing protein [Roseateles sp.]